MSESRERMRAGRESIAQAENEGQVADSTDVRKALMAKVRSGECTLEEVQSELAKIQRNAKKNGKLTRNQAYLGRST